jgi:hypothetical protein
VLHHLHNFLSICYFIICTYKHKLKGQYGTDINFFWQVLFLFFSKFSQIKTPAFAATDFACPPSPFFHQFKLAALKSQVEHGFEGLADVLRLLLNEAMKNRAGLRLGRGFQWLVRITAQF